MAEKYGKWPLSRQVAAVTLVSMLVGFGSRDIKDAYETPAPAASTYDGPNYIPRVAQPDGIYYSDRQPTESLKNDAKAELSHQGRLAARRIIDYMASDRSHTNSYHAGEPDNAVGDSVGNKTYNVNEPDKSQWIPEAYARPIKDNTALYMQVVDGRVSDSGYIGNGEVGVEIAVPNELTNAWYAKQLRGESMTLADFSAAVDDPRTIVSQITLGTSELAGADGRFTFSTDIDNMDDANKVQQFTNEFTTGLNSVQEGMNLVG